MADTRREKALESIALPLGETLFCVQIFKWAIERIDQWEKLEVLVSLHRYVPFFASWWFTPVAICAGLALLEIARRRDFQQALDSYKTVVLDQHSNPARKDIRVSRRVVSATLACAAAALVCAIITASIWLATYHPANPVIANIGPPIGWDRLTPRSKPLFSHNRTLTPSAPIINAPNGIAIGGGNVVNPTVNNFGALQRHLTSQQKQQLISLLSPYKDTPFNGVYAFGSDNEGNIYAHDFFEVFKAAGWSVGQMVGQNFGMTIDNPDHPIPEGVWICINREDKASPPSGANILVQAFLAVGLEPKGMTSDVPKGRVGVLVGISETKQP
jgi:hypothetical protein